MPPCKGEVRLDDRKLDAPASYTLTAHDPSILADEVIWVEIARHSAEIARLQMEMARRAASQWPFSIPAPWKPSGGWR